MGAEGGRVFGGTAVRIAQRLGKFKISTSQSKLNEKYTFCSLLVILQSPSCSKQDVHFMLTTTILKHILEALFMPYYLLKEAEGGV